MTGALATRSPEVFDTRPNYLDGITQKKETHAGTLYVTLNFHEGQPAEVFIRLGKAGDTQRAMTEAIARLCSAALQHGTPLRVLCKQLRGISQVETFGFGEQRVLSVPDAVAQILEDYVDMNWGSP